MKVNEKKDIRTAEQIAYDKQIDGEGQEKNTKSKKINYYKNEFEKYGFFLEKSKIEIIVNDLEKIKSKLVEEKKGKEIKILKTLFDELDNEIYEKVKNILLRKEKIVPLNELEISKNFFKQLESNKLFEEIGEFILDQVEVYSELAKKSYDDDEFLRKLFFNMSGIDGSDCKVLLQIRKYPFNNDAAVFLFYKLERGITELYERMVKNSMNAEDEVVKKIWDETFKKYLNQKIDKIRNHENFFKNKNDKQNLIEWKNFYLLHNVYVLSKYIIDNHYLARKFSQDIKMEFLEYFKHELNEFYKQKLENIDIQKVENPRLSFINFVLLSNYIREKKKENEMFEEIINQNSKFQNIIKASAYVVNSLGVIDEEKLKKLYKYLLIKDTRFEERIEIVKKLFLQLEETSGQIIDETEENLILIYYIIYKSNLKFKVGIRKEMVELQTIVRKFMKLDIENNNFDNDIFNMSDLSFNLFTYKNTKEIYLQKKFIFLITQSLKYAQNICYEKEKEILGNFELEKIRLKIFDKILKLSDFEVINTKLVEFFQFEINAIKNFKY